MGALSPCAPRPVTHPFASSGADASACSPALRPPAAASDCATRQSRHSRAGGLDGNRDSSVAMRELSVTR